MIPGGTFKNREQDVDERRMQENFFPNHLERFYEKSIKFLMELVEFLNIYTQSFALKAFSVAGGEEKLFPGWI